MVEISDDDGSVIPAALAACGATMIGVASVMMAAKDTDNAAAFVLSLLLYRSIAIPSLSSSVVVVARNNSGEHDAADVDRGDEDPTTEDGFLFHDGTNELH